MRTRQIMATGVALLLASATFWLTPSTAEAQRIGVRIGGPRIGVGIGVGNYRYWDGWRGYYNPGYYNWYPRYSYWRPYESRFYYVPSRTYYSENAR